MRQNLVGGAITIAAKKSASSCSKSAPKGDQRIMKLYDISRELTQSAVYPGDPPPQLECLQQITLGSACTLSTLYASLHAGTHADAPLHYDETGDDIDTLPLEPFIGECMVLSAEGLITGSDIEKHMPPFCSRVLIRGNGEAFLTQSAVCALVDMEVILVGTDALSIAPPEDEEIPHRVLLRAGIPILEGLDLSRVEDGSYFLFAPPVRIAGGEAAPVRAVLMRD